MIIAPAQHAVYAHRQDEKPAFLDAMQHALVGRLKGFFPRSQSRLNAFIAAVRENEKNLTNLSDNALADHARRQALALRRQSIGLADDNVSTVSKQNNPAIKRALLASIYACIVEAADRTLGLRHFDCQLLGGLTLFEGEVAEMATGEGKTLTATLAAAAAGLMRIPTHVISVNDYLTERDAEEMRPLYQLLGLSVGCVNSKVAHPLRRREYACDITYCTSKDVTFDYLRDRMVLESGDENIRLQSECLFSSVNRSEQLSLRGLHFAIVDEADSVLIDEAKTPLIISANKGGEQEEEFYRQAMALSEKLIEGEHFTLNYAASLVSLNDKAKAMLESDSQSLSPAWQSRYQRETVINQAIASNYFYQRDKHYIVVEDKIEIVDENTGRVLPDRAWESGLHQLIEIKEGCKVTQQRETINRISFQRFFQRYLHLAGMTGTGSEIKQELWQSYHLQTRVIPRNVTSARATWPTRVFTDEQSHLAAILASTLRQHKNKRPVLIGTASVTESEQISQALQAAGLKHTLLNAKQDKQEATIIANAGQLRAITVATQMAGRGTDIKLSEAARNAGGLHVIICQRFEANRIDRQLAGRCARQGDPGSSEALLCAQHLDQRNPHLRAIANTLNVIRVLPAPISNWLYRWLLGINQRRIENYHKVLRRLVYQQDESNRERLAFSGKAE